MKRIAIIITVFFVLELSGRRFSNLKEMKTGLKTYSQPQNLDRSLEEMDNKTCTNIKNSLPTAHILGGKITEDKNYPFLVALKLIEDDKHFCAGSILSTRVVLTAAHCVCGILSAKNNITANNMYIKTGINLKHNTTATKYSVKTIICHEHFKYNTAENDLAILKPNEIIIFSTYVSSINIFKEDLNPGRYVTIVGWGCNEYDKQYETSKELRFAVVQVIRNQRCSKILEGSRKKVTDKHFCTLDKLKATCFGDSGGPAIFQNQIVGVVSWGGDALPDVYSILHLYQDWINIYVKDS